MKEGIRVELREEDRFKEEVTGFADAAAVVVTAAAVAAVAAGGLLAFFP